MSHHIVLIVTFWSQSCWFDMDFTSIIWTVHEWHSGLLFDVSTTAATSTDLGRTDPPAWSAAHWRCLSSFSVSHSVLVCLTMSLTLTDCASAIPLKPSLNLSELSVNSSHLSVSPSRSLSVLPWLTRVLQVMMSTPPTNRSIGFVVC